MGEIRQQNQKTIGFSTNNRESESLTRGSVYRELLLRLQGATTVTAGNNTAANTAKGDEWGVVKNIRIIGNSTDVIKEIDGNALWWLNYFLYGTKPPVTPTLGDGATANPAFDSTLKMPFWMPNAIRPMDTALDSRQLSDLKVEVNWGTFTDINSAATAWTTEPTLEVHSNEQLNIGGPFSQFRIFSLEKEITATNSKFQVQLPVNNVYRGFLMNFTDAGVDDNAVLNNFKIKSGSNVFADMPAEVMQQNTIMEKQLSRGFSGSAYDDLRVGDDNNFGGWYLYDHVKDGRLSDAIDTLGFSEIDLELDVTIGGGTTKAIIYPLMVIPVRQ